MCAIAGIFVPDESGSSYNLSRLVTDMTSVMAHRGPDGSGHWADKKQRIFLGHRRLSVIDVTETGDQPMLSHDERYVVSYNGEIYNYPELRKFIETQNGGISWRGTSDTEILLELIVELGIEEALGRLDGMFAMAIWDRKDRCLTLSRDAFGEKPLYYGWIGNNLLFASELRAFLVHPGFTAEIDNGAVAAYFKYSYVPTPATIYKGVHKLPAASFVQFTLDSRKDNNREPKQYWRISAAIETARANPFSGSYQEAMKSTEAMFEQSVTRRMVSDVPIGSLLSGGIDSSLATAFMQRSTNNTVKTFSIGMDEPGYNEAVHARAVAKHLGTEHTELILQPRDVQEVIPDIAKIYDEPFADSSQVPTFLVSKMAREKITVALSGDGGDELFGGYNRHIHAPPLWNKINKLPFAARNLSAKMINLLPGNLIDQMTRLMGSLAPKELSAGKSVEKLKKLAGILSAKTELEFYDRLLATSNVHSRIMSTGEQPIVLANRRTVSTANLSLGEHMKIGRAHV